MSLRRPAQNHCITFTLRSTGTTTKVLVVHSLSSEAEDGENDDFGVSDESGDVFERRFVNCHFLTHSLPEKIVASKVRPCSELKALTLTLHSNSWFVSSDQSVERGDDNAKVVSSTFTRMTTLLFLSFCLFFGCCCCCCCCCFLT